MRGLCTCITVILLGGAGVTAAVDEITVKESWQDQWRGDLDSCEKDKKEFFTTKKGKTRTRKLGEMAELIAGRLWKDQQKKDKQAKEREQRKKTKETKKNTAKLSKKERLQLELDKGLGGILADLKDTSEADAKAAQESYDIILRQGSQMIGNMMRNSKLGPDTEVTLREFCDIVWRSGKPSPLDQDTPERTTDDIPDLEDTESAEGAIGNARSKSISTAESATNTYDEL
eukprot:TRINITY_DN90872_c0_g1_i1.p1 TRINITY_DN90872_c0_g1~~TRINITY_DN90872_c0_g1_i1.p1  ORF type:complete len:238 (+),score=57.37 TRINITY_DN90872_c0_g1_i1:25-714(+)